MSALYLMNFTQLEGLNHMEQKIPGLKSKPLKHEERLAHCLNGRLNKKEKIGKLVEFFSPDSLNSILHLLSWQKLQPHYGIMCDVMGPSP